MSARTFLPGLLPALSIAFLLGQGCSDADPSGSRGAAGAPTTRSALSRDHTFPGVVACDVAESGGALHLLLGTPAGEDPKRFVIAVTRSDDGGATWSDPVTLPTAHAPPGRMHRGDDPQIAAHGDRLMALWTARGDGPFGSGPLATALSDDGGRTWRPGPSPAARPLPPELTPPKPKPATGPTEAVKKPHAAHGSDPGYRFPATAAGADGFHVVWIHAAGDERSLRHALLPPGASDWSEPSVVDPHICACCWNEIRVEPDGTLLALYRDQQPSDMGLAVSRNGGRTWEHAGRAGAFDWNFDGCPHVGGGVATVAPAAGEGRSVLASVWTGKSGATGAYVVRGGVNGNWATPSPLGTADARGRNTDLAALPGTATAAAVWDQPAAEGGQSVYVAFTTDGGRSWGAPRRLSPPGENASYPRIVPAGNRFLVLWTTYAQDGAVALRTLTVGSDDASPPA
jgi:hypothetical protein